MSGIVKKTGNQKEISRIVSKYLIYHIFPIELDKIEKQNITDYRNCLEQSINILNARMGGEFKFETDQEEIGRLLNTVDRMQKEGKLPNANK